MGTSRDARKDWAFIGLKPCEASFGLQKIITFLSFKKSQRSPKGIKGGTVQSAAKGLAVKHALGGDSGPSVRGSRGQGVSRARPTRPCTSPATTFCVTLGRSPSFPEPWFTHLYTRELHLCFLRVPHLIRAKGPREPIPCSPLTSLILPHSQSTVHMPGEPTAEHPTGKIHREALGGGGGASPSMSLERKGK